MYFLQTIEEGDEAEVLLEEPEEGGRKESDKPSPHGQVTGFSLIY